MVTIQNIQNRRTILKIGIVFLGLAVILWASPLYVPFTPLGTSAKVVAITICIVLAEIFFWVGAFAVGKEYIQKFKNRINLKNWKSTSSTSESE